MWRRTIRTFGAADAVRNILRFVTSPDLPGRAVGPLANRLRLLFGINVLLVILVSVAAIYFMLQAGQRLDRFVNYDQLIQVNALRLQTSVEQESYGVSAFLLSGDERFLAEYEAGKRTHDEAMANLQRFSQTSPSFGGGTSLQSIRALNDAFRRTAEEQIALHRRGFPRSAVFMWQSEGTRAKDDLVAEMSDFVRAESERTTADIEETRRQQRQVLIVLTIVAGIMVAGGLGAATYVAQSVVRPIRRLVTTTEAMKTGDLSSRVSVEGPEELVVLATTMNDMAENLSASQAQLQHLLTETERRNVELVSLYRVGQIITSSLDLHDTLELIAEQAALLIGVSRCAVFFYYPETNTFRGQAAYGIDDDEIRALRFAPDEVLACGRLLHTRQPVIVADTERDPGIPLAYAHRTGVRSLLLVPLTVKGEVAGFIALDDSVALHSFTDVEVALATNFAVQAAIAADNARLFEREASQSEALRQKTNQLTQLLQVAAGFQASVPLEELLDQIVRAISTALEYRLVHLKLLDESTQTLQSRSFAGLPEEVADRFRLNPTHLDVEARLMCDEYRMSNSYFIRDTDRLMQTIEGCQLYVPDLGPRGPEEWHAADILVVPLQTWSGKLIGTIHVDDPVDRQLPTLEDIRVLELFAQQAGMVVENARLYERTRELAAVEERNRLARELHDSVTQSLFSMVLSSEAAYALQERDPAAARVQIAQLKETAQDALKEMRSLIFELRPASLASDGLVMALKKHVDIFAKKERLTGSFNCAGEEVLPSHIEEGLYGIAREALTNVGKHAGATAVSVTLVYGPEEVCLTIEDDGQGFDPAARPERRRTFGMMGMRERAALLGGKFVVESVPGKGTRIRAQVPRAGSGARVAPLSAPERSRG